MTRARDFADVISGEFDLPSGSLGNAIAFPSGTLMIFQQTAAPTGWTKQTTHNDKAFRCVSGTCSSGGTTAFSTAMATPSVTGTVGISGAPDAGNLAVSVSGNISDTTLSTTQISSHSHGFNYMTTSGTNTSGYAGNQGGNGTRNVSANTGSRGGGGSHNHAHNLSGTMTGEPGIGNLAGSLSSSTASINVQYVDVIIAAKD